VKVVERGLARCPRCVAVADYTFVESGPNCLRYEVRCGRCGEEYREVHNPVTPDFTAAAGALAVRVPDVAPPAGVTLRLRAAALLDDAMERVSQLTDRASSWIALKRTAFRR
jgi:hypothetical protein